MREAGIKRPPPKIAIPNKTSALTKAKKAAICEDHIGFEIPIEELSMRYGLHFEIVRRVILAYKGNGTPVTMVIPFDA